MPYENVNQIILHPKNDGIMQLQNNVLYIDFNNDTYLIPRGFETDGASIPKVFWSIIGSPFKGQYLYAALIHDYLCKMGVDGTPKASRKVTNKIFYNCMRYYGVGRCKAKMMYWAVKVGAPKW